MRLNTLHVTRISYTRYANGMCMRMLSKRDTLRIRVYVTGHDKQDVWNLYSSGYDLSYSLGVGWGGGRIGTTGIAREY